MQQQHENIFDVFLSLLHSLSFPHRLSLGVRSFGVLVKMFSTFLCHPFFSYVFVFHDRRPKRWRAAEENIFFLLSLFAVELNRMSVSEKQKRKKKSRRKKKKKRSWIHEHKLLWKSKFSDFTSSTTAKGELVCVCMKSNLQHVVWKI